MNIICVKCHLKMRPTQSGALLVVTFNQGRPYQLYYTDIYQCPSCGGEVAAGRGRWPFAEHWHADFDEKLAKAQEGRRVIYEHENRSG